MKFTFLFLAIFSVSLFSFANNGCVTAITATEQATIVAAVNDAVVANKVSEIRTLTISKCINADQMLELLGLVTAKEDKLTVFNILAGKLIDGADYNHVKSTFLN